jgi:hypothetical protein
MDYPTRQKSADRVQVAMEVRVETRLKSNRSDVWPAIRPRRIMDLVSARFEARPTQSLAPDRPAENAMVAFSAAMADASAMRGWSPEPVTSWTMKGPYGRWS